MKKNLFYAVVAIGMLASCADNEYVGEVTPNPNPGNGTESAIVFSSGTKALTRGDKTGESAATDLNNNFVFEGTKTASYTNVFNDYQANYVASTAHTTQSNSNNWEYVGYYNVPGGVTTTEGVVAFAPTDGNSNKVTQSIKYWDYATTQYDFAAYSLGKGTGTTPTYATSSAINMANVGTSNTVYTLTGSVDQLKACYISDLLTAYNRDGVSDYGNVVTFKFRSLATKIRLAFYETIPGYSVKDINFYSVAEGGSANTTPTLFTSTAVLPSGNGTMTITFPNVGWDKSPNGAAATQSTDYNKAHVAFELANGSTAASTLTFDAIGNFAISTEGQLSAGTPYIGRASNDASYAGGLVSSAGKYYTILPSGSGNNLQLRIKYTLVSTDGNGETITVDNATAVVPAELAQWQPNYAYTYIFKISDMTNGSTGSDGFGNIQYGLTPITLDAVVVDSEEGVQETITTVSDPSITTYAQGKVVTANDEYIADKPIYIIVNNGTANQTLTNKANLYTVTLAKSTDTGDSPADNASQPISEESVANAFINGTKNDNSNPTTWTVKDANKWKMVLTKSDLMSLVNVIDAADSPTGNEITIGTEMVGKFTPAAGKNYVFQYEVEPGEAAGTYDDSSAATYNATLPGAIKTSDKAYSFNSFGDDQGSIPYGNGKVKQVSQDATWTTVLVTANSIDGFVGKVYKVKATTLTSGQYYQLYDANETATGIYVTITTSSFDATDVNTYNATLTGAVKSGDTKPAVPGKYQYKIIKVQ